MSLMKGKRKREELDQEVSVVKKVYSTTSPDDCNSGDSGERVIFEPNSPKQNGVNDSDSNEKENIEITVSNGIENCQESATDEPLQSFHTKFTKSENSVPNELGNSTKHSCFSCKLKDDNVVKCSVESCEKYYHSKCLEKLPTSKVESSACPLHLCLSCYNVNPKNPLISKGAMYKCFKCPTAFHAKDECTIPGSVMLTHEVMSCPDHFSPEKQREYPAVFNLLFCVQCGCNTNLTFCAFCPYSVHKDCIKDGSFVGGKYVCNRCESRKLLLYNDIVWAKIGNFRWWPARIINPKELPAEIQNLNHFEGEVPVQFFDTDEFFWTQKGRVFPFIFKDVGFEDTDISHNFKKQMQDIVFDNAIDLAQQAVKVKNLLKVETVNNKKPPPYRHIKVNRPIGNVQVYTSSDNSDYTMCGCQSEDPGPCGYDSFCLNRRSCTECLLDVCEAGSSCQNQKFQKRQYACVKPFWTVNRGWGLKCLEEIKAGHFVIEYIGDLIDEEECERRIEEKQASGDNNFYFCTLDNTRIIDAGPKGNLSRFLNHSCDPNCETQKWNVNGDVRVGIFATKDIPAGSELTFDYQMDFSHNEKLKCNCGSQRCSGLIGNKPQTSRTLMKELSNRNKSSPKTPVVSDILIEKNEKGKPVCFKCKKGGKLTVCAVKACSKPYHLRCTTNSNDSYSSSKKWECPLHRCKKCKSASVFKCFVCPNAYCKEHVDSKLSESETFACQKHLKCP